MAALVCLAPRPARTQQPAWLQHQSWSTEAGLPQASVHQILQARDGYLWIATEGGAVRFDGVSFLAFNHDTDPAFTSNDVTSLAQDRDGGLWFGTADGVLLWDEGALKRFGERDGLPSASVLSLAADNDGSLFVLTGGGVARYDGARFRPVAGAAGSVTSLWTEHDGRAVGLSSEGLLYLAEGRRRPLPPEISVRGNAPLRGAIAMPDGGTCWWTDRMVIATMGGRTILWRTGAELPGARVQTVLATRRGAVWIGTNRGVVRVEGSSASIVSVPALGVNSILSLREDAEGDLWVGTETSGIHALRPRTFREETSLADDEVSGIVQATDGAMWIGTRDDGLRRQASGASQAHPFAGQSLTSPVILSLAPGTHGDVWAGTPDGLNHVEADGRVSRFTSLDGLPDDLVRSLLRARDGSLWIGTRGGLAHLHDGRFDVVTQESGLGADLIGTMHEAGAQPSGDLWVATLAGISRLSHGSITNYTRAQGLESNLVTGIVTDHAGRLWVATHDAGIFLFKDERFIALGGAGLPGEIDSIVVDRSDFLWMHTRKGIIRVSSDDLAHCPAPQPCRPTIGVYGVEDGLPSAELVANGSPQAWLTEAGELWFATRKGVGIANPGDLPLNPVPPPVVIEHFLVDQEDVLQASSRTIASGHTRYTFQFAGLSLTLPAKVLYRSRLQNFDAGWSPAGNRRETTYTNLPPGAYTFQVEAMNNDGVWNDAGATLSFRILPPVYRRWWFLVLSALALLVLAAAFYRLRVRRMQLAFNAVLAERTRIAREIHDTLAQDLVGATLQLDLISHLLAGNDIAHASKQVKETRAFVKSGLESARQSIWNLRANPSTADLPSRLKALVERLPAADLTIATKIGGAYRALSADIEDEILRIVQEALSNVQRHAHARKVTLELAYTREDLVVSIEDDGLGFSMADAQARSGHFGLQGMQERAASIGARLEVSSNPGSGTRVALFLSTTRKKGSST